MMTGMNEHATNETKHAGGCHCGAVRFEVTLDARKGTRCNCSICTKVSQLGALLKPERLVVVSGEEALSTYAWGHHVSTRYFCKRCGVHCFARGHLAELGGDFASVNMNCLDDVDPAAVEVLHWDGRHEAWEAGARKEPWPIFR